MCSNEVLIGRRCKFLQTIWDQPAFSILADWNITAVSTNWRYLLMSKIKSSHFQFKKSSNAKYYFSSGDFCEILCKASVPKRIQSCRCSNMHFFSSWNVSYFKQGTYIYEILIICFLFFPIVWIGINKFYVVKRTWKKLVVQRHSTRVLDPWPYGIVSDFAVKTG